MLSTYLLSASIATISLAISLACYHLSCEYRNGRIAVAVLQKESNLILEIRNGNPHGSDIIGQRVRELETEFVKAAATVCQARKKRVNEELRRKVEQIF